MARRGRASAGPIDTSRHRAARRAPARFSRGRRAVENFTTVVALTGIVVVVASLLSGAIERSGLPVVAVFLLLGAALGPWGLNVADVVFQSPALHALAMLGLSLVLFSDAVTIELRE